MIEQRKLIEIKLLVVETNWEGLKLERTEQKIVVSDLEKYTLRRKSLKTFQNSKFNDMEDMGFRLNKIHNEIEI